MSIPVISAVGLSKSYLIGHQGSQRESYTALRDVVGRNARNFARKAVDLFHGRQVLQGDEVEEFWALQDLSFEVEQGEILGIIGRNGAGKSTLLKILSRITEPTRGTATLRGRVSSLLEVGTGFHPELTGRENIYLNGAILGMSRAEIKRRFDEIVDFSEVEKFLDTPVKHFSSGMAVRLAFSVAAHLNPEILIVDEVLAVGDAAFQKKCLGKLQDTSRYEGRTVLFVSHNMGAMLALCSTGIWLEKGIMVGQEAMPPLIQKYVSSLGETTHNNLLERTDRGGDGEARATSLIIRGTDADGIIRSKSRLKVTLSYESNSILQQPHFMVGIYDYNNTCIYFLSSESFGLTLSQAPAKGEATCITAPINLTPGPCYANVAIFGGPLCRDHLTHACNFEIQPSEEAPDPRIYNRSAVLGLLDQEWSLNAG